MTLDSSTWCRKHPVAAWDFELPEAPGWAAALAPLLAALPGFATPAPARRTTRAGGDQLEPVAPDGLLLPTTLEDLEEIHIPLDLQVTDPGSGVTEVVPHGASLVLTWEAETERASPLRLLFSLEVDLYARTTWGRVRDNHALAEANQPRLTAFLARLVGLGARLHDLDAPSYRGQVGAAGFS